MVGRGTVGTTIVVSDDIDDDDRVDDEVVRDDAVVVVKVVFVDGLSSSMTLMSSPLESRSTEMTGRLTLPLARDR